MTKSTKYQYLYVVQGYYGFGWEDLTASEDRDEARTDLHLYHENVPNVSHRMVRRREPKEN